MLTDFTVRQFTHQLVASCGASRLSWLILLFYILFVVDFVLKDPREKDDDKKEEVMEHKLE